MEFREFVNLSSCTGFPDIQAAQSHPAFHTSNDFDHPAFIAVQRDSHFPDVIHVFADPYQHSRKILDWY